MDVDSETLALPEWEVDRLAVGIDPGLTNVGIATLCLPVDKRNRPALRSWSALRFPPMGKGYDAQRARIADVLSDVNIEVSAARRQEPVDVIYGVEQYQAWGARANAAAMYAVSQGIALDLETFYRLSYTIPPREQKAARDKLSRLISRSAALPNPHTRSAAAIAYLASRKAHNG